MYDTLYLHAVSVYVIAYMYVTCTCTVTQSPLLLPGLAALSQLNMDKVHVHVNDIIQ